MSQILYIVFGWVLGLFSPLIVEFFKSRKHTKEVVAALKIEFEDLQFRLAFASLTLLQSHGDLDRDFAFWVLKIVDRYEGDEPSDGIDKFLREFLNADDALARQFVEHGRAKSGVGSSTRNHRYVAGAE